ncbi:MAG: Crp/Fnr family transcriptional regulator [Bacteroides sp.]|nr:Crp/Fnr family transcriptional regulator [Bacteroides sp.]
MNSITFNDHYKEILFTIPLFRNLRADVKTKLLHDLDFHLCEIETNEVVLQQGDTCRKLYILLKGKLEVYIIDSNGNEVLIEHIEAPRAFATPHLFKEDNRFPATFKAVEDSVMLTATKDSTFQLISECPDVLKNFLQVSGRCNVCTTMRLDVLSRKTIRERLLVYLFRKRVPNSSRVLVPHTLTQLAEYLNVSRPALSTEFNKMEKEGLIRRVEKNRIELNLQALHEPI